MNGEPIPFLKLSSNPDIESDSVMNSLVATELFLDNLDPDKQAAFITGLVKGSALETVHSEDAEKLAELRLESLMGVITESASKLFLPRRRVAR